MTNRKKLYLLLATIPLVAALGGASLILYKLGGNPVNFQNIRTVAKEEFKPLYSMVINVLRFNDGEVSGRAEQLGLPLIKLKLSRADKAHFSDLYKKLKDPNFGVEYYSKNNIWRKATIEYEGGEI